MTTSIPGEVDSFLAYKVVERGISILTQQSYRMALCDFFSFLGHGPIQATETEIKQYASSCFGRKLGPRTVSHRLCVLREFFKFLQIEGLVQRNPMDRIEAPRFCKTLPRYASETEIYQLIEAPTRNHSSRQQALALRDRAICETFYAGGLRVSELTSAQVCDLSFEAGVLKVLGKGGKERIVPIGRLALEALRAYLDTGRPLLQKLQEKKKSLSPYLFLGTGTPLLSRQAVWNLLMRRARRAGIPHVHPHTLRHCTATHMKNRGADLRVIQEILGHADISTTEIYTHVSQEDVRRILLQYHPRNNPKRAQIALFQSEPSLPIPSFMPCVECTKPAVRGKTRCELHLRLNSAASVRSHKTEYGQRKLDGVCVNCSQPAAHGKVQCERHLRLNREAKLRTTATKRRAQKKLAA